MFSIAFDVAGQKAKKRKKDYISSPSCLNQMFSAL